MHCVGGLGNQLFQYAAGLDMANSCVSSLVLNLEQIATHHNSDSWDVTSFNIKSDNVSIQGKRNLSLSRLHSAANRRLPTEGFAARVLNVHHEKFKQGAVPSQPSNTSQNRFRLSARKHMYGYFADFSFFDNLYANQKDLHLVNPSEWFVTQNKLGLTNDFNAIHIRLGDYLLNKDQQGVLNPDYYQFALLNLRKEERELPIWVFSDDVGYARKLLRASPLGSLYFVEPHQSVDPAESMVLMGIAKNLIIANSTFSYWAGKLGGKEQNVFYPSTNRQGINFVKGIPDSWVPLKPNWF